MLPAKVHVYSTGSASLTTGGEKSPVPTDVPNQYQFLVIKSDGFTRYCRHYAPSKRPPRFVADILQSDNGSGYISREYMQVLKEHGLGHHRITPHCPEENGVIERSMRTLRDALEGEELKTLMDAKRALTKVVRWYNEERLHSALGYLPPREFYRGEPPKRGLPVLRA